MCEVPEMSLPVQWTVAGCKAFLESLDWSSVKKTYASYLENEASIPEDIRGVETEFHLTDISAIEYAGEEYCARDRRRTFAMRIGYLGHCFNGFQLQRGAGDGVYTVQDDLLRILGKVHSSTYCGRSPVYSLTRLRNIAGDGLGKNRQACLCALTDYFLPYLR